MKFKEPLKLIVIIDIMSGLSLTLASIGIISSNASA